MFLAQVVCILQHTVIYYLLSTAHLVVAPMVGNWRQEVAKEGT